MDDHMYEKPQEVESSQEKLCLALASHSTNGQMGMIPLIENYIFTAGFIQVPFGEDFLSVSISTEGTQQYEVEVKMQNDFQLLNFWRNLNL